MKKRDILMVYFSSTSIKTRVEHSTFLIRIKLLEAFPEITTDELWGNLDPI